MKAVRTMVGVKRNPELSNPPTHLSKNLQIVGRTSLKLFQFNFLNF
jgi:hypothetical protein